MSNRYITKFLSLRHHQTASFDEADTSSQLVVVHKISPHNPIARVDQRNGERFLAT